MLNTKTIARIAAIQVLYQFFIKGNKKDVDTITAEILKLYRTNEISNDFDYDPTTLELKIKPRTSHLIKLINHTNNNLDFIDKIIIDSLDKDKKIEKIAPLLLAILRVAIGEMKFLNPTLDIPAPNKVIVNEFTNISSEMLTGNETGFVNFLLDKLNKGEQNV